MALPSAEAPEVKELRWKGLRVLALLAETPLQQLTSLRVRQCGDSFELLDRTRCFLCVGCDWEQDKGNQGSRVASRYPQIRH